jgi:hypothetical protein
MNAGHSDVSFPACFNEQGAHETTVASAMAQMMSDDITGQCMLYIYRPLSPSRHFVSKGELVVPVTECKSTLICPHQVLGAKMEPKWQRGE